MFLLRGLSSITTSDPGIFTPSHALQNSVVIPSNVPAIAIQVFLTLNWLTEFQTNLLCSSEV